MPIINDIVDRMADWLRQQSFTPAVRVVTSVALSPPSAYPQITVFVDEELFGPGAGDVTAVMRLRVSHAGGRPADTQNTVRDLVHQVRVGINKSHGLGGTAKHLHCGDISYGSPADSEEGSPVVMHADLSLTLKYCVGVVNTE
jgi:hypothetical protein